MLHFTSYISILHLSLSLDRHFKFGGQILARHSRVHKFLVAVIKGREGGLPFITSKEQKFDKYLSNAESESKLDLKRLQVQKELVNWDKNSKLQVSGRDI